MAECKTNVTNDWLELNWVQLCAEESLRTCRRWRPFLSTPACTRHQPSQTASWHQQGPPGSTPQTWEGCRKGGERFTCEQAVNRSWSWTQVLGSIPCWVSARSAKINWNPLPTQQWQLDLLANMANSCRMEKSLGLHIIIYHIWSNLLLTAPTKNNHRTHVILQSYRHLSSSFFLFHLDEINEGTKPTKLQ